MGMFTLFYCRMKVCNLLSILDGLTVKTIPWVLEQTRTFKQCLGGQRLSGFLKFNTMQLAL